MKELIISDLSKSYRDFPVLNEINLHYISGTINGIIGNNGAGKSTLLNCIAGSISYRGNISRKNISSVGLLSANPYMFPRITGYEFVRFCLSAKNCEEDKPRLNKLNELFELPLNKYADEYSTGMLKKLHLLALFLQNNDLLLLDEPFNGLDIISSAYLSEILKQLKTTDAIVLVSSHDISQLVKTADTITLIENCRAYLKKEAPDEIERNIENEAAARVRNIFNPHN